MHSSWEVRTQQGIRYEGEMVVGKDFSYHVVVETSAADCDHLDCLKDAGRGDDGIGAGNSWDDILVVGQSDAADCQKESPLIV